MNRAFTKAILEEAKKIIDSEKPWDDKYHLIFSEEIYKQFSRLCPQFEYYDPDCSYEDDVLAWYNAAKDFVDFAFLAMNEDQKRITNAENLGWRSIRPISMIGFPPWYSGNNETFLEPIPFME